MAAPQVIEGTRPQQSWLAASLLLLAMVVPAGGSVLSRSALELKRLQGEWKGTGPGGPCSVTVEGNSLHFVGGEDFWYETTITIPDSATQPQFYATILQDSTETGNDIGRVVVALYRIDEGALTLGVVDAFDEPPETPVAEAWDWIADIYELERVPEAAGSSVSGDQSW